MTDTTEALNTWGIGKTGSVTYGKGVYRGEVSHLTGDFRLCQINLGSNPEFALC